MPHAVGSHALKPFVLHFNHPGSNKLQESHTFSINTCSPLLGISMSLCVTNVPNTPRVLTTAPYDFIYDFGSSLKIPPTLLSCHTSALATHAANRRSVDFSLMLPHILYILKPSSYSALWIQ